MKFIHLKTFSILIFSSFCLVAMNQTYIDQNTLNKFKQQHPNLLTGVQKFTEDGVEIYHWKNFTCLKEGSGDTANIQCFKDEYDNFIPLSTGHYDLMVQSHNTFQNWLKNNKQ